MRTPDRSARFGQWTWRIFVAIILVSAIAFLVVRVVPPYFVDESNLSDAYQSALNNARSAILTLVAGVALFGGLWFTGKTYTLAKETQRTERFAKAVAAVGDKDSATTRMGGVYVLWMLANESGRYWDSTEQILTSFIREKAQPGTGLNVDVQAALTILGKRPMRTTTVSLAGASLVNADFSNANISLVVLDGCELSGAKFPDANLMNSSFVGATVDGGRFLNTDLTGASFSRSSLVGASFFEATVNRTNFSNADMTAVKDLTPAQRAGMLGTPAIPPPP